MTTESEDVLAKMRDELKFLRNKFALTYCKSNEDLVAIAVAYISEASHILTTVGDKEYAAKVLYMKAYALVTDKTPQFPA